METALSLPGAGIDDQLAHVSAVLQRAQLRADFPKSQVCRWLWVASRFRLDTKDNRASGSKAAAALHFLEEMLERQALSDHDVQDINWVLESTVRALAVSEGPSSLRGCLSEAELEAIDAKLSLHDDAAAFDVEAIAKQVEPQTDLLRSFGGVGDLTSFEAKVRALFAASSIPGEGTSPARAALRYLAEEDDIVNDRHGVIGLVDDIYVVEWAYAAVESQTRCLPILEAMLARWPFIGTTGLGARGGELDRYAQYVACAALFFLFGPTSGTLVVRDTGPFPILAAVAAALECAKLQAERFDAEMDVWPQGAPLTISDGTTTFHTEFAGQVDIDGRKRYRLAVRDRGKMTVGEEILPYIARSSKAYKRLSTGTEISEWLKDRHVDPLVHLTGIGRRRPMEHEAVLLVGPRRKLDDYLELIRPMGAVPGALVGARWVDSMQRQTDLPGSATDRPLLYACGDAATACELVADPPEHIASWRILVDGSRMGRSLHASLVTSNRLDQVAMCVFAELAEREATAALREQGLRSLWYLEDQDVVVPPLGPMSAVKTRDNLERFLLRQSNHWSTAQFSHVDRDPFLEEIATYLHERNQADHETEVTKGLDLALAGFLRRIIGEPLRPFGDPETGRIAKSITFQASVLAPFDAGAARIRDLFGRFLASDCQLSDRRAAILRLVKDIREDRRVAIVCRSAAMADRCRAEGSDDECMARLEWVSLDALRFGAPYDTVIVPGWLDRAAMREVAANGYGARTELLLLPFEQRWLNSTMLASRHWERCLENQTIDFLRGAVGTELAVTPSRWSDQTARRLEHLPVPNRTELIEDETDTDRIETRAVERLMVDLLRRSDAQQTVRAQLVLFETPGTYALLPPNGHVIVLDVPGTGLRAPTASKQAERQLLLPTGHLETGMLLALPETSDRDLLDARADLLLVDPVATRRKAGLWKSALREALSDKNESPQSFARRMRLSDEPRDAATIRSWITDSRSVAPRNYRRVIPLLAELTGNAELASEGARVIRAIEEIYAARARGAELLIQEIFSGAIDLNSSHIRFSAGGAQVSFGLHRIERCAGIHDVPAEHVGRAAQFGKFLAPEGPAT